MAKTHFQYRLKKQEQIMVRIKNGSLGVGVVGATRRKFFTTD
jgi:hypothetical protein